MNTFITTFTSFALTTFLFLQSLLLGKWFLTAKKGDDLRVSTLQQLYPGHTTPVHYYGTVLFHVPGLVVLKEEAGNTLWFATKEITEFEVRRWQPLGSTVNLRVPEPAYFA